MGREHYKKKSRYSQAWGSGQSANLILNLIGT